MSSILYSHWSSEVGLWSRRITTNESVTSSLIKVTVKKLELVLFYRDKLKTHSPGDKFPFINADNLVSDINYKCCFKLKASLTLIPKASTAWFEYSLIWIFYDYAAVCMDIEE